MDLDSACSTLLPLDFKKNNPDARFSRLYFCHRLNRLQHGLSAIAELLVHSVKCSVHNNNNNGKIIVTDVVACLQEVRLGVPDMPGAAGSGSYLTV